MAKTNTKLTHKEAIGELVELQIAADAFSAAIHSFKKKYNPDTVGLDEFIEDIEDTLHEIREDIDESFQ